jgi:transcriptional regulator with XRE-family HTH domain
MATNKPQDHYSARLLIELTRVIAERRRELCLSQEEFSDVAGFSRSYVSDIERGERSFGLRNLVRLATALDLTPSELIRRAEIKLEIDKRERLSRAKCIEITTE